MRRTSDAGMLMADGEPNGDTRAFAAIVFNIMFVVYVGVNLPTIN